MLLDLVTILCSITETTIIKYYVFPLHLKFLLLSTVPLYGKRLCDTPSALLSYMRVYVNKGEYLRTEEKCILVPVVLSIIWFSVNMTTVHPYPFSVCLLIFFLLVVHYRLKSNFSTENKNLLYISVNVFKTVSNSMK